MKYCLLYMLEKKGTYDHFSEVKYKPFKFSCFLQNTPYISVLPAVSKCLDNAWLNEFTTYEEALLIYYMRYKITSEVITATEYAKHTQIETLSDI